MTTVMPSEADIERKWYLVDAEDQVLGRLATQVATVLRGKHKVIYAPHLDVGDHVVVINAEKVKMTGMKADQKVYHHYTGYPGGIRSEEFRKRSVRKPELIIEDAVRRMLPKNKLGTHMFTKLKVYKGDKHPHQAQKPEEKALA